MTSLLRIATWNANGITNHVQELTVFLKLNKIDILLISQSHSTERTAIKIPYYTVYFANHPDQTAHAGSAIVRKTHLRHHILQSYITNKIQSTAVQLETFAWPLNIAALYSPPRHAISCEEYQDFFTHLGPKFLVAGDWNAKHVTWGSRLINPKGRSLLKAIRKNDLNYLSTGEPTYWPSDLHKLPDLLDFAVNKGISDINTSIESNLDLSSDHSPVIITISTSIIWKTPQLRLCTNDTDWEKFQAHINNNIRTDIRLHDGHDIEEAVQYTTKLLQDASWLATPIHTKAVNVTHNIPLGIKTLVHEKRRARHQWQRTRNPLDKTQLNRLTHNLRSAIQTAKNETFKMYITNLSTDDHSLWKATKKFKRPLVPIPPISKPNGSWARRTTEKANTFADYLADIFTTHSNDNNSDNAIKAYLNAPCQLSPPLRAITPTDVHREIQLLNPHKAAGYDLIVGKILKHLPRKAIKLLTTIFNSILRLCYYPIHWKHAQIIVIAKPGKPPTEVTSYRPISLLPLISKLFDRLLLSRIQETSPLNDLIPHHQFGFRRHHLTIHQCHRLVNTIKESLEGKNVCASVFLDIEQAFDRVWHEGLLYKIKKRLPDQLYLTLKSYLTDRYFQVKYEDALSGYHLIKAGVSQGSVLGPFLYLMFTQDVPLTTDTFMATFADDTAILSSDPNPIQASDKIQRHLNILQGWLKQWKIKVNTNKSVQVTFTTRRTVCPPLSLNNTLIPVQTETKYLGLHLDDKLTWRPHINAKRRQLGLKVKSMQWLLNTKSQLTLENKLILYKTILKCLRT